MPLRTRFGLLVCLLSFSLLPGASLRAQAPAAPEQRVYREVDGHALHAYVFRPESKKKKLPAILLFHGGAWQLGDATWMFSDARAFAAKGMVAISVDYRLAVNGLTPMDSVEDACTAFAWTREHANELGINTANVAGDGWSAGGHLIASCATLPLVKGVPVTAAMRPNALILYSAALNVATDPYFTRILQKQGDPAQYSPLQFVTTSLPPTLIIQGTEDTIVYAKDARAFCDAAKAVHARCEMHEYPNVGHLLTRNLKTQWKDFDADPADAADATAAQHAFLQSLGYEK